jgi:hypothetical protein
MSTPHLKKLLEVHIQGLALKGDERAAWHKERINADSRAYRQDCGDLGGSAPGE